MEREHFCTLLAVALVGGLIGGAASVRLIPGSPAAAAETEAGEITAKKLVIVDDNGKPRAVLGIHNPADLVYRSESSFLSDTQPGLALIDEDGHRRGYFGLLPNRRGGFEFFDDMDNLTYRFALSDYRDGNPAWITEGKEGYLLETRLMPVREEKAFMALKDREGEKVWSSDQRPAAGEPAKAE